MHTMRNSAWTLCIWLSTKPNAFLSTLYLLLQYLDLETQLFRSHKALTCKTQIKWTVKLTISTSHKAHSSSANTDASLCAELFCYQGDPTRIRCSIKIAFYYKIPLPENLYIVWPPTDLCFTSKQKMQVNTRIPVQLYELLRSFTGTPLGKQERIGNDANVWIGSATYRPIHYGLHYGHLYFMACCRIRDWINR